MIGELRITDLGVIEQATIELAPGLTAITGETGAGKTMVLSGLSLILGGRADTAMVRDGAKQAVAEGRFRIDADSAVVTRALEAGAELDEDGTLVALRTVNATRSRTVLGGRGVPAAVLAELADSLVTVHGQSDQNRLRSRRHQRAALDASAGAEHLAALDAYRERWDRRQALAAELAELEQHAEERAREAELLRVGLADVERVDPQPDEDTSLAAEAERLGHIEDLRVAAAQAHAAVRGTDDTVGALGAGALVDSARRSLEQAAEHDQELAGLASRLLDIGYLIDDLATDLAGYVDGLDSDPGRLDQVHTRRAELTQLTRTHGGSVADVLAWVAQAGPRLASLENGDDRRAELAEQIAAVDADLVSRAARLTESRTEAARRLSETVTEELAGLAMADATFTVRLHPIGLSPWGAEDVEMLLAAHPGAPARPLGQGASGGELSRVMLAVEVALATADDAARPATFVFDEVDAGVGGRAAVEVGRRLAELARYAQVLVVTHLPQVAAFADRHLVVTKAPRSDVVTASDVHDVTGPERVGELARMLSGDDTAAARQHATELLQRSVVGR